MKMMSGELVIEMIKPSSPTPPHLRNLQLSFLDQLAPSTYIHIIIYFNHSAATASAELKRSLSDALAIYYPLAGRLREDSWLDCNDDGAEYVEAQFPDVRISDVVDNRRMEEMIQLVPLTPSLGNDVPLAVQASFFGCGGIAVGVCMWHRLVDAMSMVAFVNAWAAACRRDAKSIATNQPSFDVSSRFPSSDFSNFLKSGAAPAPPPPEKIVTKIFSFHGEKLAAVKAAAAGPLLESPTRVEAVSAFIWKHLIESAAMRNPSPNPNSIFAATHAVDIRRRASPPLPPNFFGNACARAIATADHSWMAPDYYGLALKLREEIRKADADYVRRLEDGGAFLKWFAESEENDPAVKDEICCFTSWCRLTAYEADFGWGKPVWVSIIGVPAKNLVIFLGTKCGDGIDAWVSMVEQDIALIETTYNLLG